MNEAEKKENEFIVNAQIIINGKLHETKPVKVITAESSPKGHYNKVKNDLIDAYKMLYPNAIVAIVILP